MKAILFTLFMVVNGHVHQIETGLTADQCYNMGRAILKEEGATPLQIGIECSPEGEPI